MVQAVRMEATRTALGRTLIRLCREGLDIVCVDADLGYSTSAVKFGRQFPERFFTVGVAETNMIGVAAGLAACGKIAFCSTFAVFAPGHCFDQMRMAVGQPGTNVKLVASHGGIVTGEDGHILMDAAAAPEGSSIDVRLAKGRLAAEVRKRLLAANERE